MNKSKPSPGYEFQAAFLDLYESDAIVDLVLLDQAAALLDEIAALTDGLERDGILTTGSKGQPVAHPALAQLRAHRQAFEKLSHALVPDSAPARKAGAALANKRWRS